MRLTIEASCFVINPAQHWDLNTHFELLTDPVGNVFVESEKTSREKTVSPAPQLTVPKNLRVDQTHA